MPATEYLCRIVGINPLKLSKSENLILETELFYQICTELKAFYKVQCKGYFQMMNYNAEMEETMIDENFVKCIVKDLMEEYSLEGIAFHTQIPDEVIYELASGRNTNPSHKCIRKIIELHRSMRPRLYQAIVKKIVNEHHASME